MQLNDLELLELHVVALFTTDERSRLVAINEPGGGAPAPRLYIGETERGCILRFRSDLSEEQVRDLTELYESQRVKPKDMNSPVDLTGLLNILGADDRAVESGPAYYFLTIDRPKLPVVAITTENAELLSGGFDDFVDELPLWQPFFAVLEAGRAVSVCRSVRITPEAHEAGVETLPEFHGRGFASQVVSAWAENVKSLGAIPFYSTSWNNLASQAVARKLGLKQYGVDLSIF